MHTDPHTGDKLSTVEWVSWHVQSLIRTPWFILLFTFATVVVWLTNNPTALVWWNLSASALAIYVEWLVGTAMMGQTRRDAGFIRRIAALEEKSDRQQTLILHLVERIAHLEEVNERQLEILLGQAARPELPAGGQNLLLREAPQAAER